MDKFLLVFIIIIGYVLLLFIIKKLNLGKKETSKIYNNCCPNCTLALNRIQRVTKDRITNYLTFKIFDFKRYICTECGWEGLRWDDAYRIKNN